MFLSLALIGLVIWYCVTRPLLNPAQSISLSRSVDKSALRKHVETLSIDFTPRDWQHPENLLKAAQYIHSSFSRTSARVSYQSFRAHGNEYHNVIASFGPAGGELLVIGAHYDTEGGKPGADDNASGVAGILELARLLEGFPLKTEVQLVAFTLEEPPFFRTKFMGSDLHASKLKEEGRKVNLMLSLEMIGYFSDEPNSQDFPLPGLNLFYPSTGNFIAIVEKLSFGSRAMEVKSIMRAATVLPIFSINAPQAVQGIDFSDHLSYWAQGYDAVMVTDTSFLRNMAYHTENDTIEHLDFDRMAQVVRGVYAYVLSQVS